MGFEASPLNRVLKQAAPGNDWVLNPTGDDHTIKLDYQTNVASEVKQYTVSLSFAINYNTPSAGINGVNALYNGNIAETQWATNSDNGIVRTYGYKYDNLNRLKEGVYQKGTVLNTYNESMTYDKNGNIMHLTRYGSLNDNTQTLIDNLTYDYKYNNTSNQLAKVTDAVSNNSNFLYEFKDSAANVNDDFSYDVNGNMLRDANKGITSTDIIYNHLNLPTKITFATTGNIVYIYNALGQKVQKVVNRTGLPTETTDYLGGYQYNNATLKFFPTAEGYVEPSGSSYKYVYQYKDHLGNVRLSYDKSLNIQEENNYYPFGLKQTGYGNNVIVNSGYKYKYNGKELQDELGLNMYDYGARNYGPALGRWMNIDPKAEMLEMSSPYVYALNCPIIYLDKDGELPIFINGKVGDGSERANEKYWTTEILNTIKGSGIPNPGGQTHFVDGDRYYRFDANTGIGGTQNGSYLEGNTPQERRIAGQEAMTKEEFKSILSKLERNSDGKIIEKIQIYTHSRGAAFGEGYTQRLVKYIQDNAKEFADAENEIEFSYNMATHQSWGVSAVKGVPTYSDDHSQDDLSGNRMTGVKGAFTSDQGKGTLGAHSIKSFNKDLKAFTSAFVKGGSSKDVISNFVKIMKDKYNITVTVK